MQKQPWIKFGLNYFYSKDNELYSVFLIPFKFDYLLPIKDAEISQLRCALTRLPVLDIEMQNNFAYWIDAKELTFKQKYSPKTTHDFFIVGSTTITFKE